MLKKEYEEKLAQKEELRKKSEEMEIKLDRADKLVSGLAGEKIRWEETVMVGPSLELFYSPPPTHRHRQTKEQRRATGLDKGHRA